MAKANTMGRTFLLQPPKPGDTRPRNVWGVLKGFGKAYKEHYDRLDAERGAKLTGERHAEEEGIADCRGDN